MQAPGDVTWRSGDPAAARLCVHHLLELQEQRTPDAIAAVCEGASLTYRALNQRANQLARSLQRAGVRPEVLVGICLERSLEMVIALLAVLKAGGAYVPMDPAYPLAHTALLLADTRLCVLITRTHLLRARPGAETQVLCLDRLWGALAREEQSNPGGGVCPANLAYVIYTSGSTGRPKGVCLCHTSAVSLLMWACQEFSASELAGVLALTSLCFDLSIFEILAPLAAGGRTVIATGVVDALRLAAQEQVTLLNTVPSLAATLLASGGLPASIGTVTLAGEALPADLVQELYRQPGVRRVCNLYGPTEDTTYSTWMTLGREAGAVIPIGRALPGTRAWILDSSLRPLPAGSTGELYLGGDGLARGYWQRPDLTAERFLPDPFSREPGSRLYRTGDRVRSLPDGTIDYLGRVDQQVKVRGFRVELGAIESHLRQHPAVRAAAVVVRGGTLTERHLVAYLLLKQDLPPRDLRVYLQERLPASQVPSLFVVLAAFPLTPNGKIDRSALPDPRQLPAPSAGGCAWPRTFMEEAVAAIWSEVLHLAPLSIDENFLALGGHSLHAIRIVTRLQDALQVDVPLSAIFTYATVAALAAYLATLAPSTRQLPGVGAALAPRDAVPASYTQERFWYLQQLLAPAEPVYHLGYALRLDGPLQIQALEQSIAAIQRRHAILRTSLRYRDGQVLQVIAPAVAPAFQVLDVTGFPPALRERLARLALRAGVCAPFDLTRAPLWRVQCVRMQAQEHLVAIVVHHIAFDAWSLEILRQELAELYEAYCHRRPASLPALPWQYAQYALWQRQWLRGTRMQEHLAYWKQQLAGAPTALDLPTDAPRPPHASYDGAALAFMLPADLTRRLQQLSLQQQCTLFMTLFASFTLLLAYQSRQRDLLVGTPIAGRTIQQVEPLIGCFINTLVLRTRCVGDPRFVDFLAQVRESTLQAYAHQDLPFDRLLEELQPVREASRHPFFQVFFQLVDSLSSWTMSALQVTPIEVADQVAQFDLLLHLEQEGQILAGAFKYNRRLFRAETIERMCGQWQCALQSIVEDPQRPLSTVRFLTPAQRAHVLALGRGESVARDEGLCLHRLFEAQVERTPDALAMVYGEHHLTYGELNRRANRLAHFLQRSGVAPEVLVGLYLERSEELVIGLLGVLKAGGASVALDPGYPRSRLDFMLQDTQIALLITTSVLAERLPFAGQRLLVDTRGSLLLGESAGNPTTPLHAEHLASVIYTSGSTGRPKGTLNTQRGICNRLVWGQTHYPLTAADRLLLEASFSFDVSVWELFWPLMAGASIVLVPQEGQFDIQLLSRLIVEQQVSIVHLSISMLRALLEQRDLADATGLRRIFCGGEVLPLDLQEQCLTRLHVSLHNQYGPTEAAVHTTCWDCQLEAGEESVPIGRPIENVQVLVLDAHLQPLAVGIAGEVSISGAGLGRGYLRRADLTAERFVPDPLSTTAGARMYRSGDLARYRADGALEFLGRIDHQVKIRGFRVEPGEIETVLAGHPAVEASLVLARENQAGERRLLAYVVPAGGTFAHAAGLERQLRHYVQERLPTYMVPSAFILLETFPQNPNGKIDRKALPDPDKGRRPALEETFVSPRTPTEDLVAGIWCAVFTLRQVGVNDNFFELGGHSLLAMQIVTRVREAFQAAVPLRVLLETQTIAGLAAYLDTRYHGQRALPVPPLRPVERGEELPLSYAQQSLWFLDQLMPASGLYTVPFAFRLAGALHVPALESSLTEIVRRHEILRTTYTELPTQVIAPPARVVVPVVDLQGLEQAAREALLPVLLDQEAQRPFDLARGPLCRFFLLRLAPEETVMLASFHHSAFDAWSTGIFFAELGHFYATARSGRLQALADPPIQYADYACWQREMLQGEVLSDVLRYWTRHLQGAPALVSLPTDYPRPPIETHRGQRCVHLLSASLKEQLQQIAREEHVTFFMLLYAIFVVLLHCSSGENDLVVGTPMAGRTRRETEEAIGFFIHTLAWRTRLVGDPGFREVLAQVRETAFQAHAHQDLPFDLLVEALQPPRDLSHHPVFQVVFQLVNTPMIPLALPEIASQSIEIVPRFAKFDLIVTLAEMPAGTLETRADYATDLFARATIARMLEHWHSLLERVVEDPGQRISALEASLVEQ